MCAMKTVYILYENKEWDQGLVTTLERHGFACKMWSLYDMSLPIANPPVAPGSLILNRFSPSFATRSHGNTLGAARSLVRLLESHGHHVINGGQAMELEVSKVAQIIACRHVGLRSPHTEMVVGTPRQDALQRWTHKHGNDTPVVIKPNCGGSGNHVRIFRTVDELKAAVDSDTWDPNISIDGITLMQKMVEAPWLYRLEFVGTEFMYAVKIRTQGSSLNRCPCEQNLDAEGGQGACALASKFEILPDFPVHDSEWMLIQALTRMLRANHVHIAGIEVIKDSQDKWWVIDCNCVNTNYNLTAERAARVPVGGNERIAQWLSSARFPSAPSGASHAGAAAPAPAAPPRAAGASGRS